LIHRASVSISSLFWPLLASLVVSCCGPQRLRRERWHES
jgi:hypothetical protein